MTGAEKRNIVILVIIVVVASIGFSMLIRSRAMSKIPASSPATPVSKPDPVLPVVKTPTPIADETNSIIVSNLVPNQLFPSGTIVSGTAVAFESQFAWRIVDANGETIGRGFVMANQPDAGIPGPYSFAAVYDATSVTATGTLFVYEPSPKDGSDSHVVQIPVMFGLSRQP